MRRIRVTLTKGDARAVATHHYRLTNGPQETEWSGDRSAFRSPAGNPMSFSDVLEPTETGLESLQRTVAHQAALCGADYQIEDLGGQAIDGIDQCIGPAIDEPPAP